MAQVRDTGQTPASSSGIGNAGPWSHQFDVLAGAPFVQLTRVVGCEAHLNGRSMDINWYTVEVYQIGDSESSHEVALTHPVDTSSLGLLCPASSRTYDSPSQAENYVAQLSATLQSASSPERWRSFAGLRGNATWYENAASMAQTAFG